MDALTFAFSAVMILLIRTQGRAARNAENKGSPWEDLAEGVRYVRHERWLLVGLLGAMVSLLAAWGPWETLVPFVVRNDLGVRPPTSAWSSVPAVSPRWALR